jgi:hypothetical protein
MARAKKILIPDVAPKRSVLRFEALRNWLSLKLLSRRKLIAIGFSDAAPSPSLQRNLQRAASRSTHKVQS